MNAFSPLRTLYPEAAVRESLQLEVGGGHEIYVEDSGRIDGIPVLVLHGGPGGGSSPAMRRFFDPAKWRVIQFDQRGCGRSRPLSELRGNTTWDLVEDIEAIRIRLGVDRFVLFGGSWGATLALAYAQAAPEAAAALILRGVFLMTAEELNWFYGGGAAALLPEAWERFLAPLPPSERSDPVRGYYARLTEGTPHGRTGLCRAWTAWETAAIDPRGIDVGLRRPMSPEAVDALARIEAHYFFNRGFFPHPDQLVAHAGALADIPGVIVQGRFDLVTPPRAAWRLARAWPTARLHLVDGAGHAASEPGIVDGLIRATDALAYRLG